MNHPSSILDFFVYDIFHSDENKVTLICANELGPFPISFYNPKTSNYEKLKVIIDPHNHTNIYQSEQEIEFDNFLDETTETETETESEKRDAIISLQLNVKENQPLFYFVRCLKKYPSFQNKILMSTIVKHEDDFICQWIHYHLNLGIDHFIVYDNSTDPDESNTLIQTLDPFIKKNQVLLIKWPYTYRLEKSGFSGQTTHQNHSIYAFRNSRAITLMDVDEYLNFYTHMQISEFLDEQISKFGINMDTISSFSFLCKLFQNPENKETRGLSFFFIFHCDDFWNRHDREKCIVFPKNVDSYSVHEVTSGKATFYIVKEDGYFNHYYFLNKKDRGRNQTRLRDSSIVKHLTFLDLKFS